MREVPEGYIPVGGMNITSTISGPPTAMPQLNEGQLLICEYVRDEDMPSLNRTYICETLADMQQLYAGYASGAAVLLNWYIADALAKILSSEDAGRWLRGEH